MLTCHYLSKTNNNCASKGQNTANIGPMDAVIYFCEQHFWSTEDDILHRINYYGQLEARCSFTSSSGFVPGKIGF